MAARDKAQVARSAGVPLHGLTGATRGRGHVRALRRELHARDRRDGRLGAPGAEAIKMIGSGLELADRIKTA